MARRDVRGLSLSPFYGKESSSISFWGWLVVPKKMIKHHVDLLLLNHTFRCASLQPRKVLLGRKGVTTKNGNPYPRQQNEGKHSITLFQ